MAKFEKELSMFRPDIKIDGQIARSNLKKILPGLTVLTVMTGCIITSKSHADTILLPNHVYLPTITKNYQEEEVNPYREDIAITSTGFRLGRYNWLAIGANWRVLDYDNNFGDPPWTVSTVSENRDIVNQELANMKLAGVKLVRVGLLDSGAAFFNGGYSSAMRNDVRAFLELAYDNEIKTELVLADYLFGARHPQIFTDTGLRQSLTQDFLTEMLSDIQSNSKAKSAFLGIDLLNEPEWLVSKDNGGGWEYVNGEKAPQPIAPEKINAYLTEAHDTLKSLMPEKFATVGVSAKHTQVIDGVIGILDYIAIHHYSYMGLLAQYIDRLPTNKPWVLEEFPTRDENRPVNPSAYLDLVLGLRDKRSTGALMWMWKPIRGSIDNNTELSMIPNLTDWINTHHNDILIRQ